MTGGRNRSRPSNGATCSRLSTTATRRGSLLVTSQIPVKRWHELMGDPTIGDAILDRVVHRAHRLELKGPSLRKRGAVISTAESDLA